MKGRSAKPSVHLPLAAACLFGIMAVLVHSGVEARHGLSRDPDTYMRLAVLQHQLASGLPGLTDGTFPRDGAPLGMQIHWTLPFNLLVLGTAAPFAPALGWHGALAAAAWLMPFVSLALLAAALVTLCRAAGRGADAPWAIAIAVSSPVVIGYAGLFMVNHHVVAMALGVFAIAAALRLLRRMRHVDGAWAACYAVLAVWESLEGDLPVLIAAGIIVAAASLHRDRGSLPTFAILCPALSLAVLALDPAPEGRLAFSADRFSMLQVTMFAVIGLAPLLARAVTRHSPLATWPHATWHRLATGLAAAGLALLAWGIPAALLARPVRPDDADYTLYFWQSVAELQPGWKTTALALTAGIPAIAGLAIALWLFGRRPGLLSAGLLAAMALETLAGFASVRLATHAAALAAFITGAALHAYLRRRANSPALILLIFCLAGALGGAVALSTGESDPGGPSCAMGPRTVAPLAAALPPGAIVAADLWASPELLWRTDLRTIAGPYHRNWSGIEDLARIFRGTDDAAIQQILARRQAQALLICAIPGNIDRGTFPPASLAQRLAAGTIPLWLHPIPTPAGGNPDIRMFIVHP